MLVTDDVFHADRSHVKLDEEANMRPMRDTDDVSHAAKSPVKLDEEANM